MISSSEKGSGVGMGGSVRGFATDDDTSAATARADEDERRNKPPYGEATC